MKKVAIAILLLELTLLTSASTMMMVQAAKPTGASGTYSALPPPLYNTIRSSGKSDNTKQDLVIGTKWEGTISGKGNLEIFWTNLNDGAPDERGVGHGVVTLTAGISVFGAVKTGTLTIKLHNVVTFGDKNGGVWRIIGGTGDLEGLHGEGTLELIKYLPIIVVAYEGQVHYEP